MNSRSFRKLVERHMSGRKRELMADIKLDWLQSLSRSLFRVTSKSSRTDADLEKCLDLYLEHMIKIIPETDDVFLMQHHESNARKAFEDYCCSHHITDDELMNFQKILQESFMEIMDLNWSRNEKFCRKSFDKTKDKILNMDRFGMSIVDYWDAMKQMNDECISAIGEYLLSKMTFVPLKYLDERQEVDYLVYMEQNEATVTAAHVVFATNDSSAEAGNDHQGDSEYVFGKQLKLQMTWGRLLIFFKFWSECRKETIDLFRKMIDFLKEQSDTESDDPVLKAFSYQYLHCKVHDFSSLLLHFSTVVNKDIRCYNILYEKLQDFLIMIKSRNYTDTFQVESSDVLKNICTFQQNICVQNKQNCQELEIGETILKRQNDAAKGTAWLQKCSKRPLIHLRDLFKELKKENRLNIIGLKELILSLETEYKELESFFSESLRSVLSLSTSVSDGLKNLRSSVLEWLPKRDETISELKNIVEKLNKTSRDVAISQTVGSSVGVVGGVVAIGGLIAAPFTLGLSLIPAAVAGGIIGGAGAATSIGSSVAEIIIDKKLVEKASNCLAEDKRLTDDLATKIRDFYKKSSLLVKYIPQDELETFLSFPVYGHSLVDAGLASTPDDIGTRMGITITRLAMVGGKAVAMPVTKMVINGAVTASRIAAMAVAHSVATIGIGLDIANIVLAAVKLRKGAKSENAIKLEEAITDLENGKQDLIETFLTDDKTES